MCTPLAHCRTPGVRLVSYCRERSCGSLPLPEGMAGPMTPNSLPGVIGLVIPPLKGEPMAEDDCALLNEVNDLGQAPGSFACLILTDTASVLDQPVFDQRLVSLVGRIRIRAEKAPAPRSALGGDVI